jgi:hypothetical protein
VGLVAAALSAAKLPESHGPRARLDLPGVVLAATAAVALAWGLVRSATIGWGSVQVIGSLCLAAALFAAFALWERQASEPMLPMRLLRVPAFAAANATSFAMMASITSAAFLMSQYFQLGLGHYVGDRCQVDHEWLRYWRAAAAGERLSSRPISAQVWP